MKLKLGREFIVSCCMWHLNAFLGLCRGVLGSDATLRIFVMTVLIPHRGFRYTIVNHQAYLAWNEAFLYANDLIWDFQYVIMTSIKLVWSGWFQDRTLPVQWGEDISWQGHQIRSLRFPGNLQFGVEGILCFVFIYYLLQYNLWN